MTLPLLIYSAYGSLALFLSILHNIFLLYHIETFVSIYKIDRSAFWIGETIFLLWNSLNDPLFGWISDKQFLSTKISSSGATVIMHRIVALGKSGPLFSLAFLLFWFLWFPAGLQFVICLCLYDSFLTIVDLQHTALLADLAVSSKLRAKLNSYNSVFSCFGSSSVFLSYLFWNHHNPVSFRIFCLVLAIISAIGFKISCKYLATHYILAASISGEKYRSNKTVEPCLTTQNLKSYVKQLTAHSNFLWFTIMNLVQVFNCHFNSNFFPLFLEVLLGNAVSPTSASLILGFSFLIPHINNIYFMHLCQKFGAYHVVQYLFLVKFLISLFMWLLGPNHIFILCIFIASNRIFTEGTCKLLNLIISDLVDEDMVIHNRPQAVSALIFGTSSLLSKPGQTIAPILGTYLLYWYSGKELFLSQENGIALTIKRNQIIETPIYREGCFWLLVTMPLICAVIQLLAWTQFTLRDYRLQQIKHIRSSRETGSYNQAI